MEAVEEVPLRLLREAWVVEEVDHRLSSRVVEALEAEQERCVVRLVAMEAVQAALHRYVTSVEEAVEACPQRPH